MAVTGYFGATTSNEFTFAGSYSVASRSFVPITAAGGQAGELMVVFCVGFGDDPGATSPSGWTRGPYTGTSNLSNAVSFYRVLDGTETSSVSWINSGMDVVTSVALRFTSPASVTHGNNNAYTGTSAPTPQTLTVSSLTEPVILFGLFSCYRNQSSTFSLTTPSMTASDGTVSITDLELGFIDYSMSTQVRYKVYNSSPQNSTIDLDEENAFSDVGYGLLSYYIKAV